MTVPFAIRNRDMQMALVNQYWHYESLFGKAYCSVQGQILLH